jgi:predicted DNA-binding ribbon-helix-helix protein
MTIGGIKTSLSIEDPFFELLVEMAQERDVPTNAMVRRILGEYKDTDANNTSSKVRLAVLRYALQKNTGQPSPSEISGHLRNLERHQSAQTAD